MRSLKSYALIATCLTFASLPVLADSYSDTIAVFKNAGASGAYFPSSYGYAVFPTIGKGGLGIGGAHGKGRVYQGGQLIGDASMTQLSVGFQAGGQEYSEIIFFKDRQALDAFTSGHFSLSGDISAVAITAGASASAGTGGSSAGISGDKNAAATAGRYQNGVAVFTVAKGGLMYEAAVAGQKFSYKARGAG
jgi:lipid-binding SYLF domain-containing protein